MASVFISYARRGGDPVKTLAKDFDALGHNVWFDQDLSGGHAWWTQILGRIRDCDVFVFILDPDSLESTACRREYGYAADLNKTILPVLVSSDVSTNLLPPALSQIQYVDYRAQDRDAVLRLAKALSGLPPPVALPNPLPVPPEAPISYLGNLTSQVETISTLSYEQQSALLVDLKRHLRDPATTDDARKLIDKLRKRRDLFATIADEMRELIATPMKARPSAHNEFSADVERRELELQPTTVEHSHVGGQRQPPIRQAHHLTNTVELVATAESDSRFAALVPAGVTERRILWRERVLSAAVGLIAGTAIGAAAMTTTTTHVPTLLTFGLWTGVGGAIAGAVTGMRVRLIVVALAGGGVGWLMVTAALGTEEDAFAVGSFIGAPLGIVLAAILGVLLRKKIPSLDSR